MKWHDGGLIILAFLSETIGTVSGFGSSTFFVPTAIFFESFKLVLALTALLHIFGNISKLILFKRNFDRVLPLFATGTQIIGIQFVVGRNSIERIIVHDGRNRNVCL